MAQVVNPTSASFAPVTQYVDGSACTPAKYQLLYGQTSGKYTITDDVGLTGPYPIHAGLAAGNWFVVARAVDSVGTLGLLTPEIPFSVVGVPKAPTNFSVA